MMKRVLTLLLVLCLLLPGVAAATTDGTVKEEAEISTGPGYGYWEPGVYLCPGTDVEAISRTWDDYNGVWQILVEFPWDHDMCRAYVVARRMYTSVSEIPIEQPLRSCRLIMDADAFAGPGLTYVLWSDTVYSGSTATLLAVEDEWAFIECWNSAKRANWRVWVRLWQLDCGSDYLAGTTTPVYYSYLPEIPYGGIRAGCGNAKSIMWVQQCLRSCGYGELAVDGKWGNQTDSAVRRFCREHGFGDTNVVNNDIACAMVYMFYERGMPLSYLKHYLPD